MLTYHQRRRHQWQQTRPMEAASGACEIDDEPRNVYPLSAYWAAFWGGMSDGARFVFWLLLAILLVAAAWHVAARLAALT